MLATDQRPSKREPRDGVSEGGWSQNVITPRYVLGSVVAKLFVPDLFPRWRPPSRAAVLRFGGPEPLQSGRGHLRGWVRASPIGRMLAVRLGPSL
jgi:hypothetical protein